jgi:hypothetical protein
MLAEMSAFLRLRPALITPSPPFIQGTMIGFPLAIAYISTLTHSRRQTGVNGGSTNP